MGIFKNLFKKEYNDVRDLLEQVQESENWRLVTFKEPQDDISDDLIYYNEERNLAFKFIIDEETNTVGMKKIDPEILEIETNKKSKQ